MDNSLKTPNPDKAHDKRTVLEFGDLDRARGSRPLWPSSSLPTTAWRGR